MSGINANDAMAQFQDMVDTADANPGKVVTYTWYTCLLFGALDVILALVTASKNDSSANGSHAASFASVWTLILVILVSVAGTIILRKYHTPLAVGTLLGMTTMMSQLMFVLFAVFMSLASTSETNELAFNDRMMSAIAFILFVIYGVFSYVLGRYRSTVMNSPAVVAKEQDGVWQAEPGTEEVGDISGTPV